jgi:type I restriction enzyme M protein
MKEFNAIFQKLAYRNEFMRVFDDFLTLTLCAFGMGRYEAKYLETIKHYNRDEINLFPHLLGALVNYYESRAAGGGWVDGLGEFFEEHNGKFGRSALGQFFTPPQICDLMAQINGTENGTINDPAAGSGRCLIALDRLHPDNRLKNMYYAMDLDARCVKMCAINFVMYGLKGFVVHMDSIKQDIFSGYRVYLPETGLGVVQLSAEQCRQIIMTERQTEATPIEPQPAPVKPQKLKLFEILAR